jgi:cytochrome b subunit of formate dehydrogenase
MSSPYRILRFRLLARLQHLPLMVSFLILASTGLPLKYSYTPLASWVVRHIISLHTAAVLHRIAAATLLGLFAFHIGFLLYRWAVRREKGLFRGPHSLVVRKKDLTDFFQHLSYFIGLRKRPPKFDRWTYWEKFDYYAVFWGVIVIGSSGLTLWFPELFTRFLPGWVINAAHIIHSEEALLATAFIFTIHFFNTHLRPGAFPLDEVIFTGRLKEERFSEERPAEKERLLKNKSYDQVQVKPLAHWTKYLLIVIGYSFLAWGFLLLTFIVIGTFFRS